MGLCAHGSFWLFPPLSRIFFRLFFDLFCWDFYPRYAFQGVLQRKVARRFRLTGAINRSTINRGMRSKRTRLVEGCILEVLGAIAHGDYVGQARSAGDSQLSTFRCFLRRLEGVNGCARCVAFAPTALQEGRVYRIVFVLAPALLRLLLCDMVRFLGSLCYTRSFLSCRVGRSRDLSCWALWSGMLGIVAGQYAAYTSHAM